MVSYVVSLVHVIIQESTGTLPTELQVLCIGSALLIMQGTDNAAPDKGQDEVENDFEDYEDIANDPAMLAKLSKGWIAFIVAVVPPAAD